MSVARSGCENVGATLVVPSLLWSLAHDRVTRAEAAGGHKGRPYCTSSHVTVTRALKVCTPGSTGMPVAPSTALARILPPP